MAPQRPSFLGLCGPFAGTGTHGAAIPLIVPAQAIVPAAALMGERAGMRLRLSHGGPLWGDGCAGGYALESYRRWMGLQLASLAGPAWGMVDPERITLEAVVPDTLVFARRFVPGALPSTRRPASAIQPASGAGRPSAPGKALLPYFHVTNVNDGTPRASRWAAPEWIPVWRQYLEDLSEVSAMPGCPAQTPRVWPEGCGGVGGPIGNVAFQDRQGRWRGVAELSGSQLHCAMCREYTGRIR